MVRQSYHTYARCTSKLSVKNFGHGPALKVVSSPFLIDDPKVEEGTANFVCKAAEHFSTGTVPMGPKGVNRGPLGRVRRPERGYYRYRVAAYLERGSE